jgi:hypothetical protein
MANTRSKGNSSVTTKLSSEQQEMDMKKEQGTLMELSNNKDQTNTPTTTSKDTETYIEDDHVSSSDFDDTNNNKPHIKLQNDTNVELEHEALLLNNDQERLLSLIGESKTLFKIPLFDGQPSTCFINAQEWLDTTMIQLQKFNYTDDRLILELASYLRGVAARWFRTNQKHLKTCNEFERQFIDKFQGKQSMLGDHSTSNQHAIQQSSVHLTTDQCHKPFMSTTGIGVGNQPQQQVFIFSGVLHDDPGAWLDSVLGVIEHVDMTPQQGRDFAAARLAGKALEWYRRHRLRIVDIHTFINEFINMFMSPKNTVDTGDVAPVLTNEMVTCDINKVTTKFEQELRLKTLIRIIDDFPSFTGRPSQNIDKWLNDMHKMLTKMNITDDTKHQQIVKKLTGAAKEWYNNHQDECLNYMSLKSELKTTFSSLIRDEIAFQRLPRQQKSSETIIDYYNRVLDLCKQADPDMSDESIVKYLKQGVKQSFREKIMEQDPTTPKEFLRVARRIEDIKDSLILNITSSSNQATPSNSYHSARQYYNNNHYYNDRNEYQQQHSIPSSTMQPTTSMPSQSTMKMSSLSNNNNYSEQQNVTCYGCGQQGHYQRACPQKQQQQQQHHFQ